MPTGTLPAAGAALHKKVYDEALKGSCKGDKECAAREAWAAVKGAGWHKVGDKWVKKSDIVPEFSMYFSKVGANTKKWNMTASDTLLDLRNEAMSLELYKSFIDNIETDSPVPKPFDAIVTDSFWNGGLPYVSVAHYPALDGEGVPGETQVVYIDGNQLKAKGIFNDTPLGIATWKAVLADKSNAPDNKVRVSIGFLDLAHKHGDFVFERKSFEDICPLCEKGAGNKTYLRGYLVHFAVTRKPVNPRSAVEVDLSMTTRKEDAASIVGDELAEELAEKQKALAEFSDVIVERADNMEGDHSGTMTSMSNTSTITSNVVANSDGTVTIASSDTVLVEEAVTKTEGGCGHPASHFLVVGDSQKVGTWHLRFKDCQGNVDSRLLGAAKAALTSPGGHRGKQYAGPDKQAAIAKLKRLYKSQGLEWKGDVDEEISSDVTFEELSLTEAELIDLIQNAPVVDLTPVVEKDMGGDMPMSAPVAGPTTLKEMMDAKAAREELYAVQDMWYMTQDAIYNILADESISDKRSAITGVLGEFKNMMASKSVMELFALTEKSPVDLKYDSLAEVMKSTMAENIPAEEKLVKIQPALNELGEAIRDTVTKPAVSAQAVEVVPQAAGVEDIVAKAIQPLLEQVHLLSTQVTQLSAIPAENRVPQPRGFSRSPLAVKSLLVSATESKKLTPMERIAAQSVGLEVDE